jgi:hypothetical protein
MLETLTIQDWENYLETYFQVDTGNQVQITLKLISVTGYGQSFGGKREAFSLMFFGPNQPILPQCIYRINHPEMGGLELFLVPIGIVNGGMGYEAVFT